MRRAQPGQPGVDMIVSVSPNVPPAVYLDETYTFRVRHQLYLSCYGGPTFSVDSANYADHHECERYTDVLDHPEIVLTGYPILASFQRTEIL